VQTFTIKPFEIPAEAVALRGEQYWMATLGKKVVAGGADEFWSGMAGRSDPRA